MSTARTTQPTGPARSASRGRRRGSSFAAPGARSGRAAAASWHHLRGTPDFTEELALRQRGHRFVAGIDEVGRGCLAGPVVAAAVILPAGWMPEGLRDSKLLRQEDRERLAAEVRAHALAWSVAFVGPAVIDRINILQATLLAAATAAGRLSIRPDALLLDGSLALQDLSIEQRVVVDGDRLCASVAAASVVAKVARDALMVELDREFPGYGLASNKGYAAPEHRAALASLGLTPIHRRTFASCADVEQLGIWGASDDASRDRGENGGGDTEPG